MEKVSRYALEGICWQDTRKEQGSRLGGCYTVAVTTVCPCEVMAGVIPGQKTVSAHATMEVVGRMRDGEDMLAEGGWDDCACFVKYYTIHCVQVVTKLMLFTECWR